MEKAQFDKMRSLREVPELQENEITDKSTPLSIIKRIKPEVSNNYKSSRCI